MPKAKDSVLAGHYCGVASTRVTDSCLSSSSAIFLSDPSKVTCVLIYKMKDNKIYLIYFLGGLNEILITLEIYNVYIVFRTLTVQVMDLYPLS